jgi:hypothetical protein
VKAQKIGKNNNSNKQKTKSINNFETAKNKRKNAINCLKHEDIITAGNGFFGVRNMTEKSMRLLVA